jgi:quinol monooxygenase YgiN
MVTVTLRIKVPHKRRQDFMNSAKLILGPTRIQSGCLSCRLYQDLDQPDAVFLVEEWESREDLDRHFNSEQCRIMLSLMEASDQFFLEVFFTTATIYGRPIHDDPPFMFFR